MPEIQPGMMPGVPPPADQPAENPEYPAAEQVVNPSDLYKNLADNKELVEEVKRRITIAFNKIQNRSDLEDVWKKNDERYRVKSDSTITEKNRANFGSGIFHIGINQLASIAYHTFTEDLDNYYYEPLFTAGNDKILRRNCEILSMLLRKSMEDYHFKRQLKKACLCVYKYGNCFAVVPIFKHESEYVIPENEKKVSYEDYFLPGLEFVDIANVWIDQNIDEICDQTWAYIRCPKMYGDILLDKELVLPDVDKDKMFDEMQKYKETISSSEFDQVKQDRSENADVDYSVRTDDLFKHWVVWCYLPIKNGKKIDDNQAPDQYKVRILGDPNGAFHILEIARNRLPDGFPILMAHQSEDDIGAYHMSLGEKCESYHQQICVAQNQLADNRSKNNRRPLGYDAARCKIDAYNYGHSNSIPCDGDPRTILYEFQIADMTANIMPTIDYNTNIMRTIIGTTDAVLGVAMGGRTTANEYQGARMAASEPIFADLADIEYELIVGYMRKFMAYVHTIMTNKDMARIIGDAAYEYSHDIPYTMYACASRGVINMRDKMTNTQNLMMLLQLVQEPTQREQIIRRIAKIMKIEDADELIPPTAREQAVKAAMWENNKMLRDGQWDEPQPGENHKVHYQIHKQCQFHVESDKEANAELVKNMPMLKEHIRLTQNLMGMEQGGSPLLNSAPQSLMGNAASTQGQMSAMSPEAPPVPSDMMSQMPAAETQIEGVPYA